MDRQPDPALDRRQSGVERMMADFLLELRSEEIPARMQAKARDDLARLFAAELAKAGIIASDVKTYATPRRLALIAAGLPLQTAAVSEEFKGPRTSAPPQALEGFLRKTGLTQDQLEDRDGVWFATVEKPGRATAGVLAEAIPAIIRAFPWPKSMRWGEASSTTESLRWVRPLQGIIALLGGDMVAVEVDGIASGRTTRGHRFHSSGDVIIADAAGYAAALRDAHVIVDQDERAGIIRDRALALCAERGLTWIADEALVAENAGLTEWPVPLLGDFDPAFLEVPPEVIRLTLATNQKYFVCADGKGKLAPAFICTANIEAKDGGAAIIAGNRKVLAARLSDARFFWEQDKKTPLAVHAEKLSRITFHEKLGTVADKVERVAKLARWLVEEGIVKPSSPLVGEDRGGGRVASATQENPSSHAISSAADAAGPHPNPSPQGGGASLADLAEQAARLCKADLVTEMVGEFPELQGIMGGYYARAEGLDPQVADAIRDHYKPVGQGDDVPTAPVTVAVSLADKLDTLVGFFSIGEPPTGSKDPFALRRAALGILGQIADCRVRLPISTLVRAWCCVNAYGPSEHLEFSQFEEFFRLFVDGDELSFNEFVSSRFGGRTVNAHLEQWEAAYNAVEPVLSFLADRLKVQQREAGVRHDLIDAVFALGGEDDLVRLLARVHALQAFVGTVDGVNLLAGYKRAANILKKDDSAPAQAGAHLQVSPDGAALAEAAGDGLLPSQEQGYVHEPAEAALIVALDAAEPRAIAAVDAEDFAGAMAALATLREPIDQFFENVTVNDADPVKRTARLSLLGRFRSAVHRVADFSKIEG